LYFSFSSKQTKEKKREQAKPLSLECEFERDLCILLRMVYSVHCEAINLAQLRHIKRIFVLIQKIEEKKKTF
jgi:hypothetical protein